SFSRGNVTSALKVTNKEVRGSGTTIFFRPDPEIFSKTDFSAEVLRNAIRTKAYLNPGLKLVFRDESIGEKSEFHYAEGLSAYLRQLLEERKLKVVGEEPFFLEKKDDVEVQIALCWTDSTREDFISFANGIQTSDGGAHEAGAKAGVARAL